MAVKITIELSDESARVLRSWRSVADYFNSLAATLSNVAANMDNPHGREALKDLVQSCADDTDYLRPAISELCYQVRDTLVVRKFPAVWHSTPTARGKTQ